MNSVRGARAANSARGRVVNSVRGARAANSARGRVVNSVRGARAANSARQRLIVVWLVAGSAPAAMIGAFCYYTMAYDRGTPHDGDMVGHAATAEWLRTLPWWDWRGWSDWFFGGQAIGVNYPPLGHVWMRFTHPDLGQLAAVAIGLLVLLPWGVLHLARAMGYPPRAQRAAVAAALMIPTVSVNMHWVLPGFQMFTTLFGSWPAMMAAVIGLHAVAWAARCRRPVEAGVVAGVSVLFNASIVPGIVVVSGVLLLTSGASGRAIFRWAVTAGAAALAVCSWWLVSFVAGWERLVRWEVPLSSSLFDNGVWLLVVLVTVCVAVVWAAFRGGIGARRLAVAAASGLLVTVLTDRVGYLRAERWLLMSFLTAVVSAASLVSVEPFWKRWQSVRGAWIIPGAVRMLVCLCLISISVLPLVVLVPLSVWFVLLPPRRSWVWSSVLGWTILLAFNAGNMITNHYHYEKHIDSAEVSADASKIISAIDAGGEGHESGLVYLNANVHGEYCRHVHPWDITTKTGGRLRTLDGLYIETNVASEFQYIFQRIRWGYAAARRPDWDDVMGMSDKSTQEVGILDPVTLAGALGARWHIQYNIDCSATVIDLPTSAMASGVTVAPAFTEEAWHRSAALWWLAALSGVYEVESSDVDMMSMSDILLWGKPLPQFNEVPILVNSEVRADHSVDQAASGVSLVTAQDKLVVQAETAGWVWLRVPWDPYWRSVGGTPVHKGGPGHLIVWAQRGSTELRWSVPVAVDIVAATVTIASLLIVMASVRGERRRRQQVGSGARRRRFASEGLPADT